MIRIAVDLSGSEKGPAEVLNGAILARQEGNLEIILVGQSSAVAGKDLAGCSFLEAPLAIPMSEKVSRELLRNQDSSLFKIVRLVQEGKADAAVSGGNTACFVALATTLLGTIPNVERSGIAIFLPKMSGTTILIDAGANTATVSKHLISYAVMGNFLHQAIFNSEKPGIGLLNVGEEETKGSDLYRETHLLLKEDRRLNFIGNIEGHDIFDPKVDVVVADGFTGNCILKTIEGVVEDFASFLKREIVKKGLEDEPAVAEILGKFLQRGDFAEYSGGFLMGVSGLCVIIHGRSGAEAHRKAILRARDAAAGNLMSRLCPP
ncbi:MAG: phosphate acyltransferase PlsX [Candidatus Omnitrophota bacterium]|nr:phosphate acyltransferase PlsX [Candidatus Omnitrophota bacterium]